MPKDVEENAIAEDTPTNANEYSAISAKVRLRETFCRIREQRKAPESPTYNLPNLVMPKRTFQVTYADVQEEAVAEEAAKSRRLTLKMSLTPRSNPFYHSKPVSAEKKRWPSKVQEDALAEEVDNPGHAECHQRATCRRI